MPSDEIIEERQQRILESLADMFSSVPLDHDSPYMLNFVQSYMKLNPDQAGEIVDVFLGLTHGVFNDETAKTMWKDFYDKAINLDVRNLPTKQIAQAREQWRTAILDDPSTLFTQVGPQVPCVVESASVLLVAFGRPAPLAFDVNTAQEGVIRLVPNITDAAVERWLRERASSPFSDEQDYRKRVGQVEAWASELQFQ